ncbi:MAG: hypothetical protein WA632_06215 [Gallionella sp.]
MRQTLLLFLSTDRLHAQRMEGSNIVAQKAFTDSIEGRADFAAFLQAAKCIAYMLTDLIEEDFRHEIVPHLRGGSRTALLKRKYDQFYRNTPFHQVALLSRQKAGRRDDNMLFSALTNPSLIMPWLNILLAQKIPLVGIYSVPQISAPLIKNHKSNHLLLVSWEKFSGLRQTYFSDRNLHVSRLTPVHAELTFHDAVLRELTRTYQYLKSLSLLPSGQMMDVLILCNAADRNKLQSNLPENAGMRYDFADISEVGKQLKLTYQFADSDASQIFLHQLASQSQKYNYASPVHTHFYSLLQIQKLLNASSVLILLAAILIGVNNYLQSTNDAAETGDLAFQARQNTAKAQQINLSLPNTYAPAADMKAGVTLMRKLDQYSPTVTEVMAPLSNIFDRHPRIEIDDLAWEMNAAEPVAKGNVADVPAQLITFKGRMTGFASDYRGALNYMETFQKELADSGYAVTLITKPFDASPSGSIADKRESATDEMLVSLKLSYRPPIAANPSTSGVRP